MGVVSNIRKITAKGEGRSMDDLILAMTRALLLSLEKEDDRMSVLFAKGFLTVNELD